MGRKGESYEQRYGSKERDEEEAGQDLRREARGKARKEAVQRTLTGEIGSLRGAEVAAVNSARREPPPRL